MVLAVALFGRTLRASPCSFMLLALSGAGAVVRMAVMGDSKSRLEERRVLRLGFSGVLWVPSLTAVWIPSIPVPMLHPCIDMGLTDA